MFETMRGRSSQELKTVIKDLDETGESSPRTLTEDDILYVSGGLMAVAGTTCSPCADDCGPAMML